MNPKHHQIAAKLANAIYEKNECDIRTALEKIGVCPSTAEIIEGPEPLFQRAMIVPANGVAYVVFEGTKNKRQWISNGNIRKRKLPRTGKSHAGFLNGLLSILPQVFVFAGMWRKCRKIVIVGHSRGASEAVDFCLYAIDAHYEVEEVHLFGCPRSLNKNAAEDFESRIKNCWSWLVNNDAVWRVPFKWMGFRHVGKLMYFDAGDKLKQDATFKTRLVGQFAGRIKGGPFDGISDHNSAKEYLRLVGSLEL